MPPWPRERVSSMDIARPWPSGYGNCKNVDLLTPHSISLGVYSYVEIISCS